MNITIPGDPIPKARARIVVQNGRARAYTPARTVKRERDIALLAKASMRGGRIFIGPVEVMLTFFFKRPKIHAKLKHPPVWHTNRSDLDNLAKAALDAMNAIVYLDDKQICCMSISKQYTDRDARTCIEVNELR